MESSWSMTHCVVERDARLFDADGKAGLTDRNQVAARGDAFGEGDDTSRKSSFYEQLVEHVFISEVLQESWYRFGEIVEVLRSEVDSYGYDLVLECNGILRHVQLKSSKEDGKTRRHNVNVALATKPGGCVVWILREEDLEICRMKPTYLFFGNAAGLPLPSLDRFKVAKHSKGDAHGSKIERPAIRVVLKTHFRAIHSTCELVKWLFGLGTASEE